MVTTQDTCSNCVWWTRINEEQGECRKYAPRPEEYKNSRPPLRPITPQYWQACGDWKKVSQLQNMIKFIQKGV